MISKRCWAGRLRVGSGRGRACAAAVTITHEYAEVRCSWEADADFALARKDWWARLRMPPLSSPRGTAICFSRPVKLYFRGRLVGCGYVDSIRQDHTAAIVEIRGDGPWTGPRPRPFAGAGGRP
jgi:hypothetical protein